MNNNDAIQNISRNILKLKDDIKHARMDLDRIEINASDPKVEEGIRIYKEKLNSKNNTTFENMFLTNCLLDIFVDGKLIYRATITKKETGIMAILYMFQIDDVAMGTYYFDNTEIVAQPSIPAMEKLERVVEQVKKYSIEARGQDLANITVLEYAKGIVYEVISIMGYINALALADRQIVQGKTFYRDTKNENSGKTSGKGKKKKKFKKISLLKKYVVRPELIRKDDNKQLKKSGRIYSKESWNVAGHWRTYRDKTTGEILKKVWVSEYKKGQGKTKNKVYVID